MGAVKLFFTIVLAILVAQAAMGVFWVAFAGTIMSLMLNGL